MLRKLSSLRTIVLRCKCIVTTTTIRGAIKADIGSFRNHGTIANKCPRWRRVRHGKISCALFQLAFFSNTLFFFGRPHHVTPCTRRLFASRTHWRGSLSCFISPVWPTTGKSKIPFQSYYVRRIQTR